MKSSPLTVPIGIAVLVAACGGPSPSSAVVELDALLPTLATYHVTDLQRTDGCEFIAYQRGAFTTDPASEACMMDLDGPSPRKAFDGQSRADLDAIYRVSMDHGPRIESAFPEYGANGMINGGQFGFDSCTNYIYHPGWKVLPDRDADFQYAAINADWYEMECVF